MTPQTFEKAIELDREISRCKEILKSIEDAPNQLARSIPNTQRYYFGSALFYDSARDTSETFSIGLTEADFEPLIKSKREEIQRKLEKLESKFAAL